MKFFLNSSIKKRLTILFIIFIGVFILINTFSLIKMQQLGELTIDLYNHPMKVSRASFSASLQTEKIHNIIKDVSSLNTDVELNDAIRKVNLLEDDLYKNMDIIRDNILGDEGKKLEKDTRNLLEIWKSIQQQEFTLLVNNNKEEALKISRTRGDEYSTKIQDKMTELTHYSQSKADDFIVQSQKIQLDQKQFSVIYIIASGILLCTIFIITMNSILTHITTLKKTMNDSISTGKLIECELDGNNEITDMSKDFNELVKMLKSQFWIKEGQNELNLLLSGNLSLNEICGKSISFISRYLNSGKGVFYLLDNKREILSLKSSFAYNERESLSNEFKLGSGIVGQVGLEKKPILLKNIKRSEEIITTGTISQEPLNIYAFPIVFNDVLYGVIELASFEPFDRLRQEFLNECNNIISSSLYSAVQRDKINELLHSTEKAMDEAEKARIEALNNAKELKIANIKMEEQHQLLQQQTEEIQQANSQLEEQHEQLQQQNCQLEEHQMQLKQQTELLNTKNRNLESAKQLLNEHIQKLEISNKYKSEFLANMSHELRTPLNSIILLSKLLERNEGDNLNNKELEKIKVIYNAGNELLRLINDILDLSKIESGKMDLNISEFSTEDFMKEFQDMFISVAKEKGLKLYIEDKLKNDIKGDKDKISQIIRNFLSNAFKFTKKGSVKLIIEKTTDKEEDRVKISVKDTGIGIPKDRQDIIFEEFQQVDGSISREFGGTGLGLSICRKMADFMGAKIELISEENTGSEFSLLLPDENHYEETNMESSMYEIAASKIEDDRDSIVSTDKVVLIIDDDANFALNIANISGNLGFKVLIALNGKDGLKLAANYKISGILLDLTLPDMKGIDLLKELKSTKELCEIPVYIVSALKEDGDIKKIGALGYIQKPVDYDDIVDTIKSIMNYTGNKTKQLLIVEDDNIQRDALKEILVNKNIEITRVETEEEAIEEIKKGIYDAVILDLKLKVGEGMGICKYISDNSISIPVIVYTAKDLSIEQENQLKKYADSIIIKTAHSEDRLFDEVTMFLRKVKDRNANQAYIIRRSEPEYNFNLNNKRILIVDDDPKNIFVLASALENYGADIIAAQNGRQAVEQMKKNSINLVLMDIMMPVMDGYEAIKAIRSDEQLKHIPIIALTAKALKEDKEKAIQAGANDYISKPVDYDTLIHLVNAWISKEV